METRYEFNYISTKEGYKAVFKTVAAKDEKIYKKRGIK